MKPAQAISTVSIVCSAIASLPAAAASCTIVEDASFAGEKVRLARAQGLDAKANFGVFKAPLAVNTDGAPTSYHPEDFTGAVKAINRIDNGIAIRHTSLKKMSVQEKRAVFDKWRTSPDWRVPTGYKITWQNVIAADPKGHPCIFKQENAGYFGSLTALTNGLPAKDAGECQANNQLDQRVIPAIVLRGKDNPLRAYGAKTGDLVLVGNPANDVVVAAVIGDTGDGGRIGEGSVALNMALLKTPAPPTTYAAAVKLDTGKRDMVVAVLPGSAGFELQRPYTAANIAQRVEQWTQQRGYGSADKLMAAATACAAGL